MTNPVPGGRVSSPYGPRAFRPGVCGFHTGVDLAAPTGTPIVAARPGRLLHVNYGSAYGNRQFAIRCDDGTEDFYAHCETRAAQGRVQAGQQVGTVGARGAVTGPHLHFERHTQQRWACSVMTNPQPSIDWQPEGDDDMTPAEMLAAKIKHRNINAPLVVVLADTLTVVQNLASQMERVEQRLARIESK